MIYCVICRDVVTFYNKNCENTVIFTDACAEHELPVKIKMATDADYL